MKTVSLKSLSPNKKTKKQSHILLNKINRNPIGTINVSGIPVTSFEQIYLNKTIHTIIARNTKICSFAGSLFLSKLMSLDLSATPLANEPLLDFMSSMAFGPNLYKVNGQIISQNAKNLVKKYSILFETSIKTGLFD